MAFLNAKIERESQFWDARQETAGELDPALFAVAPGDRHDKSVPWLPYLGYPALMQRVLDRIGDVRGKRVLDLGTGSGFLASLLARNGATVDAVDVSPASLEVARRRAELSGVAEAVRFHCMPGEHLDFPDESFDAIAGVFVLHHLDLAVAAPEIRRVLRPGASAAFIETSAASALLMAARRWLPGRFGIEKASSDDEAPLGPRAQAALGAVFENGVRFEYPEFVFFRMMTYVAPLHLPPFRNALGGIDALLRHCPGMAARSYHCVVVLRKSAA